MRARLSAMSALAVPTAMMTRHVGKNWSNVHASNVADDAIRASTAITPDTVSEDGGFERTQAPDLCQALQYR